MAEQRGYPATAAKLSPYVLYRVVFDDVPAADAVELTTGGAWESTPPGCSPRRKRGGLVIST
jgi:hypothetical protein